MTELTTVRPTLPSSRQLLARVLDERELVAAIQHLTPPALARLIDHVGLEDAGELIALATTDQLVHVFDEDLWRPGRPGGDEAFDAARFLVWLEVMLEAGAAFTAARIAELPEDLVIHAVHQHALVVDLDALAVEVAELGPGDDDGEAIEKALEGCLYHELDAYRVIARRHDGWDALVTVLVALDEEHHDLLLRILERCCALSGREIEDGGGLTDVLTSEEMLAGDVAADREDRRARAGYVAPSSARAFLRLAATTDLAAVRGSGRDPVTRAYFRELEPPPTARADRTERTDRSDRSDAAPPRAAGRRAAPRPPTTALAASADPAAPARRLTELLRATGVLDDGGAGPALLGAGDEAVDGDEAAFRAALIALLERDPARHGARIAELAYLANVLVAGADAGGRSVRPAEAATAAVATCALGLAHLRATTGEPAVELLAGGGADLLFRIGWRLQHDRGGDPTRALVAPRPAPAPRRPGAGGPRR